MKSGVAIGKWGVAFLLAVFPATGQDTLSGQYLKDRAKMLAWKMQYDTGAVDDDEDSLGNLSHSDKSCLDADGLQAGAPSLISGTAGNDLRNRVRNEIFWEEAA